MIIILFGEYSFICTSEEGLKNNLGLFSKWVLDMNELFLAGEAFQQEVTEHIQKAVQLEIAYAKDVFHRGILGLNADMFVDYMHYIGNRRLEGIGLEYRFPSDKNPFPWLGEVVDVQAMGNFFESRVREYQQSGSLEDDF